MLSTSIMPQASVVVAGRRGPPSNNIAVYVRLEMMYKTNKVTNSVQVIACLPALQRLNKFTFLREYNYASEWILQTFAAVMLYSGH